MWWETYFQFGMAIGTSKTMVLLSASLMQYIGLKLTVEVYILLCMEVNLEKTKYKFSLWKVVSLSKLIKNGFTEMHNLRF